MAIRFMGKNPLRKVVRQIPNRNFSHRIQTVREVKKVEEVKENKEVKTNTEMADERLEKIEQIMGTKAPKRSVKREKKEKGLIERTDNSTILLTEDNKMLLND